jgi:hypothetical protein
VNVCVSGKKKAPRNVGLVETKSHFRQMCPIFEKSLLTCCVDLLPVKAKLMDFF